MKPCRLHLAILHGAALLVPGTERAEWLSEWKAELWYVKEDATVFCLGSLRDALWLGRNRPSSEQHIFKLQSPLQCVLFLAGVAVFGFLLSSHMPTHLGGSLENTENIAVDYFWIYLVSLPMLAAATPMELGEYPANRSTTAVAMRLKRWLFLAIKVILLVPSVLWWSCVVSGFVPAFASMLTFVGLAVGFRWAIADQRQRCPVCLRRLSNPIQIGDPSRVTLGWCGTEFICSHGHGLLYVPETRTTWYSTQRWESLDPSWRDLFC